MKIGELKEDTIVTLNVGIGVKTLELKTTVCSAAQDYVLLEPIVENGKVVMINTPKHKVDLVYAIEGVQPQIWRNCALKVARVDGETFYMVATKRFSQKINRRDAFRVDIGGEGTVYYYRDSTPHQVIVKDISTTGFAIVTRTPVEHKYFHKLRLSFLDKETNQWINLVGTILREDEVNSRYVYGGKILETDVNVGMFVCAKQRARSRRE